MARRFSIDQINEIQGRKVLFDANVLIYIFGTVDQKRWEKEYASMYARLLEQKNEIFVSYTVISEFVNSVFRSDFEIYKTQNTLYDMRFKDFRNASAGKEALEGIYIIVKENILKHFGVVAKKFFKPDIEKMLKVDSLDFGDKAILSICQDNNFVLLTNDTDFTYADIDILTSHPKILKG